MMPNCTDECNKYDPGYNRIPAVAMFLLAIGGICVNTIGIYHLWHLQTLRSSFGLLFGGRLIASIGVLVQYVTWNAPLTFFGSATLLSTSSTIIGKISGVLCVYFWYASLFMQQAIAVNRFVAIAFPFHYEKLFTRRRAIKLTAMAYFASLVAIGYYFFGCDIYFETEFYGYTASRNKCNAFWYGITVYSDNLLLFIILLMDLLTIGCLRNYRKRAKRIFATIIESTRDRRRISRELRFYAQALITDVFLLGTQVNFFICRPIFGGQDKMLSLMLFTLPFIAQQIVEGLLILLLNPEIRSHLCSF